MKARPFIERLREHQERDPDGCWIWEGSCGNGGGYGWTSIWIHSEGRRQTKWTHRLAWELLVGPIPAGMTLDHLCPNTRCMNPKHLDPCTRAENSRRARQRRDTGMCKRGHPLVPGNLYKNPRARDCATCRRAGKRARYRRLRAQLASSGFAL